MRLGAAALLVTTASCALVTSWGDLPLDRGPVELDASAPQEAGADAPADGAVTDASPPPDASKPDASKPDAGLCTSGRLYCGGDGVVGDPTTLYRCGVNGTATAVVLCQKGCAHKQPAKDDACVCVAGGLYCGNDQVVGDPAKLYTCNADYTATLTQSCPNACVVRPGQDDICK